MADVICSFSGCPDPATVTVQRSGKPYCRGHGLAEALKRPACAIMVLPEEMRDV